VRRLNLDGRPRCNRYSEPSARSIVDQVLRTTKNVINRIRQILKLICWVPVAALSASFITCTAT
jgi:hypothetical protein